MSSEGLPAPRERLSRRTPRRHHAIVPMKDGLDVVDRDRHRADDREDGAFRETRPNTGSYAKRPYRRLPSSIREPTQWRWAWA